jgi:hypothetical protein
MSASALAREYEARWPGAVTDPAQAAERMQRLVRADQAPAPPRCGSPRSLVVPALPWKEER